MTLPESLHHVPLNSLKMVLSASFGSVVDTLDQKGLDALIEGNLGNQWLLDKNLRRLYFQYLDEGLLRDIWQKVETCRDQESKVYDIAVRLANKKWGAQSELVKVCWDLGLSQRLLPEMIPANSGSLWLDPISPAPQLFDYQVEASDCIVDFLNGMETGLMIQMPTGSGKTITAINGLARWVNASVKDGRFRNILWLAHSKELIDQAFEQISLVWPHWGKIRIRLSAVMAGSNVSVDPAVSNFVVASQLKLSNLIRENSHFFSRTGFWDLIVIDEAHRANARTMKELLNTYHDSKRIGLSATPGRSLTNDDENSGLAKIFSSNLFAPPSLTNDPITLLQKRGILAHVEHAFLDSDDVNSIFKNSIKNEPSKKRLMELSNDSYRNEKIINLVLRDVKENRKVLIFSCSVEHAKMLSVFLASRGVVSGVVTSESTFRQREVIIDKFREGSIRCVLNFGVLSEGFDVPDIDTVVIARPTTSLVLYSQMVGRALRGTAMGGKSSVKIVDVLANFREFGGYEDIHTYFHRIWD